MNQENKIREGPRGTSRTPAADIIPPDAEPLSFRTNSYEFFVHRSNGNTTLYVRTTDYHPGILAVPMKKLAELISYLKTT